MMWLNGSKHLSRLSWLQRGLSAGLLGSGLAWAMLILGSAAWNGLSIVTMKPGTPYTQSWTQEYGTLSARSTEHTPSITSGCRPSTSELISLRDSSNVLLTWLP